MFQYNFDCGCSFKQFGKEIKSDGFPSISIDFENLRNCPSVWDICKSGKTKGIFQLETNLGRGWSKKIQPFNIEEMSALISLIRPGCLESFVDGKNLTSHYALRKFGKEESTPIHPALSEFLKETNEILVYQEQILRIIKKIAGYSIVEAENFRKILGKKKIEEMQAEKNIFIEKCEKTAIVDKKDAEYIFSVIEASQRYSFNKCLCPSTIVETKNGFETLENIKIGDFINSPDGFIEVLDKIDTEEQELFEITLESGKNIKCTINHKFLCEDMIIRPLYEILANEYKIVTDSFEKIIEIKKLGKQKTLDIEVKSKKHIFYGNQIATSNSHGVGYGKLGYYTLYAKHHFPLHFYTAYLAYAKESLDPKQEIEELIDDLKDGDIEIYPPRLTNNNSSFSIFNGGINFGIDQIKGLGYRHVQDLFSTINTITKSLNKNIINFKWLEFLIKITPLTNSTVVNNLILVGATPDNKVSRKRKVFEYKVFSQLTERELKWFDENYSNYESLADIYKKYIFVDRKDGGPSTVKRKEILENLLASLLNPSYNLQDEPEWIINNERNLLGVPLSYNSVDSKDIVTNRTISDFLIGKDKNIKLLVEINQIKEHLIKKEGDSKNQKMAFLKLKDGTGSIDGVIFSKNFLEYQDLLYNNNIVIIEGRRSDKNDNSLIIDSIKQV